MRQAKEAFLKRSWSQIDGKHNVNDYTFAYNSKLSEGEIGGGIDFSSGQRLRPT